jgi:hypothetical protein
MRYWLKAVSSLAFAVVLVSGCGEQAVHPVFQALCEAACGRGFECFPEEGSVAQCISECVGEVGGAPCERPDQGAVDACVAEIADLSCEDFELELLPPICSEVCSGCTGPEDCDDENECTADSCDPDGRCTNAPVADGTPCGVGGATCQAGVCMGEFPCTEQGIRDAIATGWGPHTFACSGSTTVPTQAEIVIDNDVILDGESQLTVDGMNDHPVFSVGGFASAELRGFVITRGRGGGSTSAGGITNPAGVLTLTRTTITENTGGGVYNEHSGTMTFNESTVSDNTKEGAGAGIYNVGNMTLTDSAVSGNTAHEIYPGGIGGGIYNTGTLTLIRSVVSHNAVNDSFGYAGGGIHNRGSLSLTDSVVSNNTAGDGGGISTTAEAELTRTLVTANTAGDGGGINCEGGTLDLVESTVSSNTAIAGGGVRVFGSATFVRSTVSDNSSDDEGGGILVEGALTLINSTISRNTTNNYGGGISNPGGRGITLTNCTIAENAAFEFDAIYLGSSGTMVWNNSVIQGDCSIAVDVSGANNIESPGDTCGFDTNKGDQVNVTAEQLNLGPLADNGGPTETHALGTGSVAIDVIAVEDCGQPLTTDQRGEPRPEPGGTMCDVGAFEVQP